MVTPWEVPVIDIGYVPLMVPFDEPLQPARAARIRITVTIPSRTRWRLAVNSIINRKSANITGTICHHESGGAGFVGGSSGIIAWAIKVAVAVCAVTPSLAVTEAGETVQLDFIGAPVQASATARLKPPNGVIVTLKVVLFPLCTGTEVVAASVKSQPVPERGTVCGLPPALSVIVSVPLRAPTAVGANVTLIVQLVPAANVAGLTGHALAPVLVSAKSPDAAIELMVNAPVPVFVSVTV